MSKATTTDAMSDGWLWPNALEIAALWGLAVVQPLLDQLGQSPEFFLASGTGPGEIIALGLIILLVPPVVLMLTEAVLRRVRPRLGKAVHVGFIAGLGALLGLNIARQVDITRTVPDLLVGALTATAILLARQAAIVRLGFRYLGVASLGFLALFLFASDTGRLIWADEAEAIEGVTVPSDGPVVVIVFDELPLASLLRADGTLNTARFPNFGRLADTGTWYRNATALAPATIQSVPSLLTGSQPVPGALPTSTDFPISIFTTLGNVYEVEAYESVTDLCPDTICAPDDDQGAGASFVTDVREALLEATVAYGNLTLPADLAAGDFAEALPGAGAPDGAGRDLARLIEGYDGGRGTLLVGHDAFLPHLPWSITAAGSDYDHRPGEVTADGGQWPDDSLAMRRALQRHLLKVGYADQVLGGLLDRLEVAQTWDDATIVVTADHGISFTPGGPPRAPTDENVHEIYRVPLFIKAPGQQDALVSDDNALLIDVLPTILDLVDADLPASMSFDGESLVDGVTGRDTKPVTAGTGPDSVPGGFEELLPIARRNAQWLGDDHDTVSVLGPGPAGDLLGRSVEDLSVGVAIDGTWEMAQLDEITEIPDDPIRLPVAFTGSLRLAGDTSLPVQVLIVIDDHVEGLGDVDPTSGAFTGLLDETALTAGRHEVNVYLPLGDDRIAMVHR